MKKLYSVYLIIFILAVVPRLYGVANPIADWHSWRQSDTAAVARNYLKWGIDPLHPRYDDLSNIQSGKDNPQGYRMVEFPLYQIVGALFARFIPIPIEVVLRLISIGASAISALVLFYLVSSYLDQKTGFIAAVVSALLPYSIYYGRTILPENFMVALALGSIAAAVRSRHGTARHAISWVFCSAILAALALLVKPVALFLLVPIGYLLFPQRHSWGKHVVTIILFCVIAVTPLLLWRQWITQFPEGIPVYIWLFNANNIRFKGAWFYWLFAKRIGELILGYWGLIPFGLGIVLIPRQKEGWFFRWWAAGILAYLVVLAAGNVQHDYYQILLIPTLSVFVAKGLMALATEHIFSRWIGIGLAAIAMLFAFSFSWYTIRTYYWINRPEIVEAGRVADKLLPPNAKVIASYNGDTTFLYQINRQGWPLGFDIDKKIAMGATHYVTVSPTDADFETMDLARKYTVLVRNDKFAIIDLTKPKK